MSGYRLSPIRNKGWLRLGLTGAVGMIPYTAMEHAQGRFSEGAVGLQQAGEFLVGGMCVWLVIGFAMSWVLHGFAVKAHDDEDQEGSRHSSSSSHSPSPGPARPPAVSHGGGSKPH
ncbi:MAG TPA: hypothetical protein VM661_10305 [Candidatus Sulfotelmatobacter sp.]|jgi:hypothetical protein|nr:hypothetical protein [Candidatus Sulfotelmatobacter sp.]